MNWLPGLSNPPLATSLRFHFIDLSLGELERQLTADQWAITYYGIYHTLICNFRGMR